MIILRDTGKRTLPAQEHLLFLDFQNHREKGVLGIAINLFKKYLKIKCFPTFSPSYLMQQSCYYQRLRSVFYELCNYEQNDGAATSKNLQLLEPTKAISYFPLSVYKLQQLKSIMKNRWRKILISTGIIFFQIVMG